MADISEILDHTDDTFYGVKYDNVTGKLIIEVISNGDQPIVLEHSGVISRNDYKTHLWSDKTITPKWGSGGHLLVEIS